MKQYILESDNYVHPRGSIFTWVEDLEGNSAQNWKAFGNSYVSVREGKSLYFPREIVEKSEDFKLM